MPALLTDLLISTAATGLVDGPADVVGLIIDTLTLHIQSRGDVLVRVHGSPFVNADPVTRIETTPDGWILLRDARPGTLQLFLDETAFTPDTNQPDEFAGVIAAVAGDAAVHIRCRTSVRNCEL